LDGGVAAGDRSPADLREATAEFVAVRGRLFGIAYRMLGSRAEAEDIVQETWLRWQNYDHSTVKDSAAFLATTTTRLCLNVLQSARARREPTSALGFPSRWTPAPIRNSVPSAEKHSSWPR
jgi:RNA polymerase sigma-70 factor (ECF subfamily)